MRSAAFWFPVVAAGAALVVILLAPRPAYPPAGPAGWEPGEAAEWADPAGAQLSRELDTRCRGVAERSFDKSMTALALTRGELTLDQAADRFSQLNHPDQDALGHLRRTFPGASDAELLCRQVILFVRGNYRLDPARVAACVPLLEAEVSRRFSRDRATDRAPVPLPTAPSGGPALPAGPVAIQSARVR